MSLEDASADVLSLTGNTANRRWNLDHELGSEMIVTYSVPSLKPAYDNRTQGEYASLTEAHKIYIRSAFSTWDAASGISFVEVPDGVEADINVAFIDMAVPGNSTGEESIGFAYYPTLTNPTTNSDTSFTKFSGDIFMDSGNFANAANSIAPGSYGYIVLLHEIGHSIGLKHPFSGFPTIQESHDNGSYTIMSYNFGNSTTQLGSVDVEATQLLYGGETATSVQYNAATGVLNVSGSGADGLLVGSNWSDSLTGSARDETLKGGRGEDQLVGGSGDDILNGGRGADILDGGAGNDTASYAAAGGFGVLASLEDPASNRRSASGDTYISIENITGSRFSDTLVGDDADNVLIGGGGAYDQLFGGDGNDFLIPGRVGRALLDGGDGIDTVSFVDMRFNAVSVDLTVAEVVADGDIRTLRDIENITGTIFGDYIVGDEGNNRLRGLGDYDWFVGSGGSDYYHGGNGRDMVSYADATGSVTVDLAGGRGRAGQAENDRYVSIERVTGSSFSDILYGDDGANDLRGLGGHDVFVGSSGGRERYDGGAGLDTVTYFASNAGVTANLLRGYGSGGDAARDLFTSIENLGGTSFDDILAGDNGRNNLRGLAGQDRLMGNGGIDRIYGGAGDDFIDGGAGSDYILFDSDRADYTITRQAGTRDAIISWNGAGAGEGTDTLLNVEYLVFADTTVDIWSL